LATKLRGLYGITDDLLLNSTSKLLEFSEAVLQAGTGVIQYRAKNSANKLRLEQASLLVDLCAKYDAICIINDDVDLAYKLGCGVHLGREDGCLVKARKLLGINAVIGATCHNNLQFAKIAKGSGASYLAFGRFFLSNTKPNALSADFDILTRAKRYDLPIVAIGGITLDNARQVLKHDVDMLAVCYELFSLNNVQEVFLRAKQFTDLFL